MRKIQIAVFVSGGGTNLQALIDAQAAGNIPSGEIALVVSTSPSAFALKRAKAANIACVVVSKTEYPAQEKFEARLCEVLEQSEIELIVLAGFMLILSSEFTKKYKNRIINVHPSLIPSFCGKGFYGLKVHASALAYGVKLTGATVHYVNEVPDGGEIISQKSVEILEGDTAEILQRRVMEQAEWIILPQACEKVCRKLMNGDCI